MEFTRASQVVTEVLFHSSMMTSRSWWMLEILGCSTFHLRMPHRCSVGFKSVSRSYLSSGLVLLHVLASILGVCKALWDPLCFQPSAVPPPGGGSLSHISLLVVAVHCIRVLSVAQQQLLNAGSTH
ncbi:unnamed protein product, partial [Staurois parvus]